MATETWTTPSSWTSAFTASTLDGLTFGSAILSDVAITNSSTLAVFCDLTLALGSATFAAPYYVGVFSYPLDANSVYGDGRFASASSGTPPGNYAVGSIGIAPSTTAQSGTLVRAILVPGTQKFVLWNQTGVTWNTSGSNTLQYRIYNRAIA